MPKFIIVDHSILNLGGHHYEYAVHVLKAAESAGYKPVLATNRAFKIDGRMPWEMHPIYKYGFWFRLAEPRWYRWINALKQRLQEWLFQKKCALVFSTLGFFWVIRNELSLYLLRQRLDSRMWIKALIMVPLIYGLNLLRTLKSFASAIIPFRHYLKNLLHQAGYLLKALLYPFVLLARPEDWMLRWVFDLRRMQVFGYDTKRLFQRVRLEEGDIVFLPTVSEVEMLGLLRYFRKDPNSAKATWHLLFRRNIYTGREPDYWLQDEEQRPRKRAFLHFTSGLTGQKVYFYTDTDELTAQYNRLGTVPFRTLPIPHTHPPRPRQQAKAGPLRIIYIGDARAEKGYHYLLRIVGDLWADYVETGEVVFAFQSNFNALQGEPEAVIARAQLECFPPDKVRLIYEPLPTEEYRELLLSADIILLPYNRDHYYARSSGILVEALAAGIPVIVPAGTWLAQPFAEETYRYHQTLRQRMMVVKSRQGAELRWRGHGQSRSSVMFKGELTFGGNDTKAYCWLAVPKLATHLLVSFQFAENQRGIFTVVHVDQQDSEGLSRSKNSFLVGRPPSGCCTSILVPLAQGVRKIWLGFKNAFVEATVYLTDVQVDFLTPCELGQRCPLGVVGLAYSQPDELTDVLREMIDNYAHYRDTARASALRIFEKHNAGRLVEELRCASEALPIPNAAIPVALTSLLAEQVSQAK